LCATILTDGQRGLRGGSRFLVELWRCDLLGAFGIGVMLVSFVTMSDFAHAKRSS